MMILDWILDLFYPRQIILGMLGAACLFVPWGRRRRYFPLRIALGTVLLLALMEFFSAVSTPVTLNLLLSAMLLALLIWACFDCGITHAVFSATCAYAVQHITSKLTYMVIYAWHSYGSPRKESAFLLLLLTNAIVCAVIFFGFTRRVLLRGELLFDSTKTVVYFGLFLTVAVYLSFVLESNLDRAADTFLTSYLALNALCVLFAVAILSMEFSNCSIKRLENENMILARLLENDRQRYEQARQNMEKINIRYHDLKQQYSRAGEEEREKLEAEMKELKLYYYTGNKALDIALTQKAGICQDAGIQLVCSVDGRCLSGMTHYHIYSLLGNAIDNAIECLAKVEDGDKKVIDLSISRRGDMAVICVENYTPELPVLHDGALVTTKADPSGHGYGMKSIKNIAELYGGTADYFVEDGVFYLLVTLPYMEVKERPADRAAG